MPVASIVDMNLRIRQTGFTMIELLIVVIIVGILVGLAMPKYREFYQSQSLVSIHNAALTKFREAPILARTLRKNVYVKIDLDNEKIWLEVPEGNQYGTKVPADPGQADIKGIDDATTPMTTGIASYEFRYWGTVVEQNAATTTYTMHFGLKSDPYSSAAATTATAIKYRTITLMQETGRAYGYMVGCGNLGSWKDCPEYL